jgi:hypothetical protein
MTDELDLMIGRVKAKLKPGVPLYLTAAEVFYEFADEMSDETSLALEEVGRVAIKREGQAVDPITGHPLPEVFAGFLALVAEQMMDEGVQTDEEGRPHLDEQG